MEFLELKDISERFMELVNPTSPEKVVSIGRIAGLKPGNRVIDFGCGFGEALALWAEHFEIKGLGIDIRPYACQRAQQKMALNGFAERIEIVCGNGSEYRFVPHDYDLAVSMGSTFIWGGFQPAILAMKEAIRPDGKLVIGEPYWKTRQVPPEFAQDQAQVHTEFELLALARQAEFDIEYVARASTDDWDHYEASNWYGLLRWIEENPDHPERQEVIEHLHNSQDEYFRYAREFFGWAIYLLNPVKYP